jgi:hypothetical protein
MNHMNDQYKELIRARLALKDSYIEGWLEELRHGRSALTGDRIEFLGTLAEKNLKFQSNKQNLSDPQRQMKTSMHEWMRNVILDLSRMANYDFIGPDSRWNPDCWGGKSNLPFDPKIMKEFFSAHDIANFIEAVVGMYGDEFAIPIANGIEKGLSKHEGWDSKFDIEVPVIRKAKKNCL